MFTSLTLLTQDTVGDVEGKMIAYGESADGYIARCRGNTVNGLPMDFIFENYEWVYLIDERAD